MIYIRNMSQRFTGYGQTFGDLVDFVKYKGILVLFTGIECAILENAIIYKGFEYLKRLYFRVTNKFPTFEQYPMMAFLSFLTLPLSVVRDRLITQVCNNSSYYINSFECFKQIYEYEGFLNVYKQYGRSFMYDNMIAYISV